MSEPPREIIAAPLARGGRREESKVTAFLRSLEQLPERPDLGELDALLRKLGAVAANLDRLGRELMRERAVQALTGKV